VARSRITYRHDFVLVVDVHLQRQVLFERGRYRPRRHQAIRWRSDPGGTLVAGQPQWVFYDGQVFRLMGGGGGSRASGDDRERDAMARRFIAAMETMPYARAMSLETTAGDVHKTTTSNAVGNATINAATAGLRASTCGSSL
jgi:hypothetical protein